MTTVGCSTSSSGTGTQLPDASFDASFDASVDAAADAPAADAPSADATVDVVDVDVDSADATADASAADAAQDDAPAPDAEVDAAPCPGLRCGDSCIDAGDCSSCPGAPLQCGQTCVAACAGCVGADAAPQPIECFACDSSHENPIGTCAPKDSTSYCLNGNYLNARGGAAGFHCLCDAGDPSSCPGSGQVCAPTPGAGNICVTCGEVYVYDLNDAGCKNGKSCNTASAACE